MDGQKEIMDYADYEDGEKVQAQKDIAMMAYFDVD